MDVMEKFIAQGRAFFEMGERFARSAADSHDVFDWEKLNEQALGNLKKMFDWSGESAPNMGFWQLPLDNWQRTMSSMAAPFPGDYLRGFSPEGFTGQQARAQLNQFLSTPSVGYSREFQDQYQHLAKLALAYEKANQRYFATFMDMGKRSVELLQKRLHERSQANNPITSLRELYNLWVDCSEEVYGAYVLTDDYVQVHGELVNALMDLKHHGSRMVDDIAGAYNLPTRVEMDTVHRRLQQSRRDNHNLLDQVAELSEQIEQLRDELKKMTKQVAQSQAGTAKAGAAKSAGSRTAKKKTGGKAKTTKAEEAK